MAPSSKVLLFVLCALISMQSLIIVACGPYVDLDKKLLHEFARRTPNKPGKQFLHYFSWLAKNRPTEDALICKEYETINSELKKRLPDSDNLEQNLDVAQQWLMDLAYSDVGIENHLGKALFHFCSLSQLRQPGKQCNEIGHWIIDSNKYYMSEDAAGSKKFKCKLLGSRVREVAFKAAAEHAKECKSVYMRKYEYIFASKIGNETREEIENGCLSDSNSLEIFKGMPLKTKNSLFAGESLKSNDYLNSAIEILSEHLAKALRPRVETNKQSWNEAFEEHIFKPCKEYIDSLEDEVFLPAIRDLALEPRYANTKVWLEHLDIDRKLADAIARYGLCRAARGYPEKMINNILNK